ncbi:MAG: HAD-IIIA family hydrolase [Clostridia bacterium]|nr:HAD-IIIA family hydrolase [Clostridia bacterium]
MKYKLAIFDLDGTLLDTLEDLKDSVNFALAEYGLPTRSYAEIRRIVGHGIRNLVDNAVPEGTAQDVADLVFEAFKTHYKVHCADKTAPYPGIPELLQQVRAAGIRVGVISNKADGAVQELMRTYFAGLVDVARGEIAGIPRKPAPDGVWAMIKEFGIDPADAVYIGDSEVDIETADNAGLDHIIVTWGFRDRELLESRGARVFADAPAEVFRLL